MLRRRILAAVAGELYAVRDVAGQMVAVASDEPVYEFLCLPHSRNQIEPHRPTRASRNSISEVHCSGAMETLALWTDCPRAAFALADGKTVLAQNTRTLERRHRHAMAAVARFDETHRPGTESSSSIEDKCHVIRRTPHSFPCSFQPHGRSRLNTRSDAKNDANTNPESW